MPKAPFADLIATASRSAVHLELRDAYTPDDPRYQRWLAGEPIDFPNAAPGWFDTVREAVDRGVVMRRARVVSEPLSDYIRYEYEATQPLNVAAGEDVRWLPRNQTLDLCLPGLDFWLFDDHTLRVHHFAGDGRSMGHELVTDSAVLKHCADAFTAVWERAVPHEHYRPD